MVNEVLRTELPDEWEALSLGEHSQIFRGGSPRPIQEFLTTSDTGVNWIKIGDVDADAIYNGNRRKNHSGRCIKIQNGIRGRFDSIKFNELWSTVYYEYSRMRP